MSKKEIKVRIVGIDPSTTTMFRNKESAFFNYFPMVSDVWEKPDLVVFTGGEDVNPTLYNENPLKETYFSDMRDREDMTWYNRYIDVPKVGICRGGQFLNVMAGGSMWQHVDNHGLSHTLINLLPMGARWAMGDLIKVTSTHHQMMIPGEDGEVIGIAMNDEQSKGIANTYLSATKRDMPEYDTEVVYYDNTRSLCYQAHPEYIRDTENEKYFFDLIEHLLL